MRVHLGVKDYLILALLAAAVGLGVAGWVWCSALTISVAVAIPNEDKS